MIGLRFISQQIIVAFSFLKGNSDKTWEYNEVKKVYAHPLLYDIDRYDALKQISHPHVELSHSSMAGWIYRLCRRYCGINLCLIVATCFLLATMYLNMMALNYQAAYEDYDRSSVYKAQPTQKFPLPERIGQREMRDPIVYHHLKRDPADLPKNAQQVKAIRQKEEIMAEEREKAAKAAKKAKVDVPKPKHSYPHNNTDKTKPKEKPKLKSQSELKAPDVKAAKSAAKPVVKSPVKREVNNPTTTLRPHIDGFLGNGGKIILLWTPLTPGKPLWNIKTWRLTSKCQYQCQATNDTKYLSQASLVLFRLRMLKEMKGQYLREFLTGYNISDLPQRKYDNQVWVDVNQESPMYSHSDEELAAVDKSFNYIVSYLSNSDYTYDYKLLHRKKTTPSKPVNYAAGKKKMAIWYVSHCDALSGRQKYVTELQKYNITVDIFGKCSGLKDGCNHTDMNCIKSIRSQYRFYLAFENSICSEYITEKFWNTLKSDSYNIPISLGAKMEEYTRLSPPNSFLHVRNFTTPKHLADYMHKVAGDDKLFNSYHSWREHFEMYKPASEEFDCWLCRMAHQQPPSNHTSYSQFWSRKKLCEEKTEPT